MNADSEELDIANLLSAWTSRYEVTEPTDEEAADRAAEELNDIVYKEPELAWRVIQQFLNRKTTPWVSSVFSAGPLESFISSHGENYIDEIEKLAAADQRFSDALHGIYQNLTPDHIWERVEIARDTIRCLCCRSASLTTARAYEVCAVCGWEDNPKQAEDPESTDGSNATSLTEARKVWASTSTSSPAPPPASPHRHA